MLGTKTAMRYSDNLEYLIPAIHYLGTNQGWWARSSRELARELSLDEAKLLATFEGFPAVFRKSKLADDGRNFYALQARYAKRDGSDLDEKERVIDVPPLPVEHLKLVLDFVVQMADSERTARRNWTASVIAVVAAVLAAISAMVSAGLKLAVSGS